MFKNYHYLKFNHCRYHNFAIYVFDADAKSRHVFESKY